MKCQRCQKREATILIRQSMNGKEKEYALCQDCLMELGFMNSLGLDLDKTLGAGFVSPQLFFSYSPANSINSTNTTSNYNSGVFVPGIKEQQVCRHCNTTLDEIRKKGRLGCSYCYETFEEQLGQVFRRIQSGDKHRGRKIAESKEKSEINKLHALNEELQMKIKDAVEKEDYESAAKWKTQILKNKEAIEELEKKRRLHEISKTVTAKETNTAKGTNTVKETNTAKETNAAKQTKSTTESNSIEKKTVRRANAKREDVSAKNDTNRKGADTTLPGKNDHTKGNGSTISDNMKNSKGTDSTLPENRKNSKGTDSPLSDNKNNNKGSDTPLSPDKNKEKGRKPDKKEGEGAK